MVGVGPGDPELITVAAQRAIEAATVINSGSPGPTPTTVSPERCAEVSVSLLARGLG